MFQCPIVLYIVLKREIVLEFSVVVECDSHVFVIWEKNKTKFQIKLVFVIVMEVRVSLCIAKLLVRCESLCWGDFCFFIGAPARWWCRWQRGRKRRTAVHLWPTRQKWVASLTLGIPYWPLKVERVKTEKCCRVPVLFWFFESISSDVLCSDWKVFEENGRNWDFSKLFWVVFVCCSVLVTFQSLWTKKWCQVIKPKKCILIICTLPFPKLHRWIEVWSLAIQRNRLMTSD